MPTRKQNYNGRRLLVGLVLALGMLTIPTAATANIIELMRLEVRTERLTLRLIREMRDIRRAMEDADEAKVSVELLNGKVKLPDLGTFGGVQFKGGDISVGKILIGVGAAYICGTVDCVDKIIDRLKTTERGEIFSRFKQEVLRLQQRHQAENEGARLFLSSGDPMGATLISDSVFGGNGMEVD